MSIDKKENRLSIGSLFNSTFRHISSILIHFAIIGLIPIILLIFTSYHNFKEDIIQWKESMVTQLSILEKIVTSDTHTKFFSTQANYEIDLNGIISWSDNPDLAGIDITSSRIFTLCETIAEDQFSIHYLSDISDGVRRVHLLSRFNSMYHVTRINKNEFFYWFPHKRNFIFINEKKVILYSTIPGLEGDRINATRGITRLAKGWYISHTVPFQHSNTTIVILQPFLMQVIIIAVTMLIYLFIALFLIYHSQIIKRRITRFTTENRRQNRLFGEIIKLTSKDNPESRSEGLFEVYQATINKIASINSTYIEHSTQNNLLKDLLSEIKELLFQFYREKERLTVTINSIAEAVIATDKDGRIILVNKEICRLTGIPSRDLIGCMIADCLTVTVTKQRTTLNEVVTSYLFSKQKHPVNINGIINDVNNNSADILMTAAPILDNNNSVNGIVFIIRDVTIQNRYEEEIKKKDRLNTIGQLAGGIAHDFNNILSAIVGNISLIHFNEDLPADIKELTMDVETAAYRARELTQQLLTFAKGGTPVLKTSHLDSFVQESVKFITRGSNVSSKFLISDNLPPVAYDKGQISQVINNIVINAQHSLPDGGTIEIVMKSQDITTESALPLEPGNYVSLSISDKGHGIPAQYIEQIFNPFFTTKEGGSGLGLSICFSIIQKHNGWISVKSKENEGTTFTIYLPAQDKVDSNHDDAKIDLVYGSGRVLVLDDDIHVRSVIVKMLISLGYTVTECANKKEVLENWQQSLDTSDPFILLILDLTIPGGPGGIPILKELLKSNPSIKAILASGYGDRAMADYREYGFADILAKPFKLEEVSTIVNNVLQGNM